MALCSCWQGYLRTTPFVPRYVRSVRQRTARPGRCGEAIRVAAVMDRGSSSTKKKNRRRETRRVEEEVKENEEEVETAPVERVHESVAVDPPKWSDALRNRNFGPWAFGGMITSFALYVLYLVFIKDRSQEIDQIDADLNAVMSQLQKVKEVRMEPDMSDTDIIRVRSFLLSLIIKQKKQDPAKVVNSALSLLGERHLNKREKKLVLGVDERVRPQLPEAPENLSSPLNGLTRIDAVSSTEENLMSPAFDPDASALWWRKLPYICVLQMKKSRALFMTAVTEKDPGGFAIVGFEDPEEAFHAGKMPVHEQLWGVLSAIKYSDAKPMRPLEDEKHFDLTWLQPKEFNALMESAGCYGLVIPAGTLRSPLTERPIAPDQIKAAIQRICSHARIGAVEGQPSQLDAMMDSSDTGEREEETVVRSLEEDGVDLLQETETESPVATDNTAVESMEMVGSCVNGLASKTHEKVSAATTTMSAMNGFQNDDGAGELFRSQPLSSVDLTNEPSSETPSLNGISSAASQAATTESSDPWWFSLDTVVVPKIKPAGQQGGNVEMNISVDPDVTDFRPVLFEDEREAKGFLGILGKLHGPQTLVATITQSPREFLDQNKKLKQDKVVVLCTGSLLLDRDADRNDVRNAVRMAHVATEIKKGVSSSPSEGGDADLDTRAMKVAQDVVSNFKDRLDSNVRTRSRPGDTTYQDPLEGLIHDLEHGGLDELLGRDSGDGISATVGDNGQEMPFPGLFTKSNEQDDGLYAQFAAQMTESIDKARESFRNANAISSPPIDHEEELNISLDALIDEKEAEERQALEVHSDGLEVVFPKSAEGDKPHATGPRWFSTLDVIYVPTYLTVHGFTTYLAMTDLDLGKRLVVGFQDRQEALTCREMMKNWGDKEYMAAGVAMVPPHVLLAFCKDHDIEPVVLRRSSVQMTVGMSQSMFLSHVGLIANTQATNYTVFNGDEV